MRNSLRAIICFILLCMAVIGPVEAKKHRVKQKPVYMIGVCMSLVDSTIFLTDMHRVDDATIAKKTHFLMDRQLYSLQLKQYLESMYEGGPYIPVVYSDPKRKKMERKYLSLHKRYLQSKELRMYLIDQSQFRFKPEKYVEDTIISEPSSKKSSKKGSKKEPGRIPLPNRTE